jgi:hypothetical protein
MKQHIPELLKRVMSVPGAVLEENEYGYPVITASLSKLPNRLDFLDGLVPLLDHPRELHDTYYTEWTGPFLNDSSVNLKDFRNFFPLAIKIVVVFRLTTVAVYLYHDETVESEKYLAYFWTRYYAPDMHFEMGEIFDATSVHAENDAGIFIVTRDFTLQELTNDFFTDLDPSRRNLYIGDLMQFGVRKGYLQKPKRKLAPHIKASKSSNGELVVSVEVNDQTTVAKVVAPLK